MNQKDTQMNNRAAERNSVTKSQPAFLRVSRVAEILDMNKQTVYDLINRGELENVTRIGSRLRIPEESLSKLISKGRL